MYRLFYISCGEGAGFKWNSGDYRHCEVSWGVQKVAVSALCRIGVLLLTLAVFHCNKKCLRCIDPGRELEMQR